MSKGPLTIWFDDKGNMLTYSSYTAPHNTHKSEVAKDFDDRMRFVKIEEYRRKNTRVVIKSVTTGREYSMFTNDFNAAVKANQFIDSYLEGTWRFIKRSSGQAIILLLPGINV